MNSKPAIESIEVIELMLVFPLRKSDFSVGQRRDVHIYRLMVKNTIEERISQLQETKLKLAGDVLAGCIDRFSLKLEDIAFFMFININNRATKKEYYLKFSSCLKFIPQFKIV